MVLVDPKGMVRKVHVGASPTVGRDLRSALDEVLGSAKALGPATEPE
jgi:hypothetical protein